MLFSLLSYLFSRFLYLRSLFFRFLGVAFAAVGSLLVSSLAYADWTPLISSDDFTGMQDDMLTMVAGIVSIVLIVVGLGFLIRSMTR